jgi:hypothetical protein
MLINLFRYGYKSRQRSKLKEVRLCTLKLLFFRLEQLYNQGNFSFVAEAKTLEYETLFFNSSKTLHNLAYFIIFLS